MTLRNIAFVPRVPFDICSYNAIQEEHAITLHSTGVQIIHGRALFRKEKFGNCVEATKVVRHGNPPAHAAAALKPGKQRWIDVNDLHRLLGHAHDMFFLWDCTSVGD